MCKLKRTNKEIPLSAEEMELAIKKFLIDYEIQSDKKIVCFNSIESIGKYIYYLVQKTIVGVTVSQINKVVEHTMKLGLPLTTQKDYYKALSNFYEIHFLPKQCYKNSRLEFENLRNNYNSYLKKIEKKKKEIDCKLQIKKNAIKKIESPISQAIKKNISADIDLLRQHYLEIRRFETYQEIIEFDSKYVEGKFEEYCGLFRDEDLNDKIILNNAWEYIKATSTNVFSKYSLMQHYLDVAILHLSHELNLFFSIKLQPIYEAIYAKNFPKYMAKEIDDESYDINTDFSEIPSASVLISKKTTSIEEYNLLLRELVEKHNVLDSVRNILNVYPPLNSKKELILRCINFFEDGDYRIFANLVSVQIEALFYDLLIDTNMFDNFRRIELFNNKVLKEKINTLGEETFVDITEYFSTYFNNLIRNAIAHGRENVPDTPHDQEAFALELLLDLNSLLFLFSRKSEIIKMHRFICSFSNPKSFSNVETMRMEMLFRTLCGDRLCDLNYTVNKYNPIQVVYWLVNPTYEEIYAKAYDISLLTNVRTLLLDKSFWRFCNNKIDNCITCGYNYLSIGSEFQACVNLILGIIDNNDTKKELIETNKKLKELEKKDKNC